MASHRAAGKFCKSVFFCGFPIIIILLSPTRVEVTPASGATLGSSVGCEGFLAASSSGGTYVHGPAPLALPPPAPPPAQLPVLPGAPQEDDDHERVGGVLDGGPTASGSAAFPPLPLPFERQQDLMVGGVSSDIGHDYATKPKPANARRGRRLNNHEEAALFEVCSGNLRRKRLPRGATLRDLEYFLLQKSEGRRFPVFLLYDSAKESWEIVNDKSMKVSLGMSLPEEVEPVEEPVEPISVSGMGGDYNIGAAASASSSNSNAGIKQSENNVAWSRTLYQRDGEWSRVERPAGLSSLRGHELPSEGAGVLERNKDMVESLRKAGLPYCGVTSGGAAGARGWGGAAPDYDEVQVTDDVDEVEGADELKKSGGREEEAVAGEAYGAGAGNSPRAPRGPAAAPAEIGGERPEGKLPGSFVASNYQETRNEEMINLDAPRRSSQPAAGGEDEDGSYNPLYLEASEAGTCGGSTPPSSCSSPLQQSEVIGLPPRPNTSPNKAPTMGKEASTCSLPSLGGDSSTEAPLSASGSSSFLYVDERSGSPEHFRRGSRTFSGKNSCCGSEKGGGSSCASTACPPDHSVKDRLSASPFGSSGSLASSPSSASRSRGAGGGGSSSGPPTRTATSSTSISVMSGSTGEGSRSFSRGRGGDVTSGEEMSDGDEVSSVASFSTISRPGQRQHAALPPRPPVPGAPARRQRKVPPLLPRLPSGDNEHHKTTGGAEAGPDRHAAAGAAEVGASEEQEVEEEQGEPIPMDRHLQEMLLQQFRELLRRPADENQAHGTNGKTSDIDGAAEQRVSSKESVAAGQQSEGEGDEIDAEDEQLRAPRGDLRDRAQDRARRSSCRPGGCVC